MSIHMIKLTVGVESLAQYAALIKGELIAYEGQMVNPVWTRNMPRRAAEMVRDGSSIYRVIKNRIQCRQRILGFEQVEHPVKGKMHIIMTESPLIRTVAQPHRPFQGWRYLKPAKAPRDIGVYTGEQSDELPPEEMSEALEEAGLL